MLSRRRIPIFDGHNDVLLRLWRRGVRPAVCCVLPNGSDLMELDQLKRRSFITLLGGVAAWPLAVRAQQVAKVARIGFLALGNASAWTERVEALRSGLRDLGYVEGNNILIEFRQVAAIRKHAAYSRAVTKSGLVQCRISVGPPSVVGQNENPPHSGLC